MFSNNNLKTNIIKLLIWFIKSLSFGIVVLFLYNIVGANFNLNIPFNIITILIISIFKLPGLACIIIFMLIT